MTCIAPREELLSGSMGFRGGGTLEKVEETIIKMKRGSSRIRHFGALKTGLSVNHESIE